MKTMVVMVAALLFGVAIGATASQASHVGCHTGDAQGFATLRPEPQDLIYSLPSSFTSSPLYFESRYNCERRNVLVRRLGLGTYEVLFPGLNPRATVVTAISEEGVSASYHNFRDGIVRVTLRGPLAGSDVAARRDVAFSVVVF